MNTLLDEYYRYDLHNSGFIERKHSIGEESTLIYGIAQSGKTSLIKSYLLTHKKSTYLYFDCRDSRLDINELNSSLKTFCRDNKISILALDNYVESIELFEIDQVILSSEETLELPFHTIHLELLDYEEFLAFESKFDSTALNHFFQLGGFPAMHKIASEDRVLYLQSILNRALEPIEFSILSQASKMVTQKVSAFNLYERLKGERKISKDKLYLHLQSLFDRGYLKSLGKFNHPSAVKKLYLCDIAIKHALVLQKHFGRIFENLVFSELDKRHVECYYDEGIDFYLPQRAQIIIASPFANEHALFKKVEALEGFIVSNRVREVIVVTMNLESTLSHPISRIEMIPFERWALGDDS
ncbi:MAG: ATP-binding protein [Sulfuricurvum sp.]|uniref:ATP-binding protein n=1 Tax=Sulfuricurvum sp. TaxID=2025608 RepID=UPI002611C52B|nr:ATP-binding protein [Sulfuricurvum sp.]MDD2951395.1 ATP-binding protein [Sulfuricurvum sp.]MDD5117686.1 ATP-binding protein [Sulfuricurvum sp.]